MLVDVHAHIGRLGDQGGSPELVAQYAAEGKFDAVLVSHEAAGPDEVDANSACLAACRTHALLRPLYSVRVGHRDSNVHALRGAFELEPFIGAVFSPAEAGFDVSSPLIEPYLAMLAVLNRPAVFCIGGDERSTPVEIYTQARRQRKLPVLLCLCGSGPSQRAAVVDVVGRARQAGDAELFMDTSYASASDVQTAVDVAGAERVLFGSDVFGHADATAERLRAFVEELRNCLSAEQFRLITEANATRLFRLAPNGG